MRRYFFIILYLFAFIANQPPVFAAAGTAGLPAVQVSDVLLLAVELDGQTLSETFQGHGDPEDPLLPVGELSRLLGLAVNVEPMQGRATGRLGESQRSLIIDLATGEARSGSTGVAIGPEDAKVSRVDIYVRSSILSKLLPVSIDSDGDNLIIVLHAKEKLPLQARQDRMQRRFSLGQAPEPEAEIMRAEAPFHWFGRPGFDVSAEVGNDSQRGGLVTRLEGRVAADLMQTSFSGYLATDDRGNPASARILAERRSAEGNLLGPLHATYAAAGDVFTPALALGPRSMGGAGASFSTARLEAASVFERIDMRGELPAGYDVELYVNDVLRAGQDMAAQGRYEFRDVPLVRGVNVIRIVTYGPRGERFEDTRVINVGGGQIEKGRTVIEAGVVLQERPVIDLGKSDLGASLARGEPRAVFSLAHGLTKTLTVQAGGAFYADARNRRRKLLGAGLRTSLAGLALQLDHAHDFSTGSATSLGLAGRLAGISLLARHAEYGGAFADENVPQFDVTRPMRRYSELTFDLTIPFLAKTSLPLSGRVERAAFRDGGETLVARARSSMSLASTLVAFGADYTRQTGAGFRHREVTGNIAASRLIGYKWQLRASSDFDIAPHSRLRAMTLTADRSLSERHSLRLGMAKSFGEFRDLTAEAGLTAHLPMGDASLTGDYSTKSKRWRVGLQLNFGFAFDPQRRSYRMTPPGPANGASAAFHAFRDANANGIADAGEEPVSGIRLQGPDADITTDAQGRAFVTGLGNGPSGQLRIDTSAVDTVFDATPPSLVAFEPRAGSVIKIDYPIVPASEVAVSIKLRQADGSLAGLSAVRLRLMPEKGSAVEGATEFDGLAVFESVKPGRYRIELDPEQARQLHMRLAAPITIAVGGQGTLIRAAGEVEFEKEQ